MSETTKQMCEGDCNPLGAPCGAKFCTYEAMQEHARKCQAAAPASSGPAALVARLRGIAAFMAERQMVPTVAIHAMREAADALASASPAPAHAECHDLVCNGSRAYPRGVSGHGCSCRGREQRAASPAPACASCAECVAHEFRRQALQDSIDGCAQRVLKLSQRALTAEALQQSQAQEIQRLFQERNDFARTSLQRAGTIAVLYAALKAHDDYMTASGYSGPEDDALHRLAAANWRDVRTALKGQQP